VLTTPVIRCLKKQLGAEIHYLTKYAFRSIIASNPYVDKVITIKDRVGEVTTQLRSEKYDIIVDLHKNLRSYLVKVNLPFVKYYSFNKLNFEKWLVVNFKINHLPNKHLVDRYFEELTSLGITNDGKGLDFFTDEEDLVSLEEVLPTEDFTALVIGAGYPTKALTIPQIVSFINESTEQIVLLGGPAEQQKAKEILQQINRSVTNLVGQLSLSQSASCIKMSAQVMTGDTGLMHIAAAFHKPILSIWGNTIPEFGMFPYYGEQENKAKIVQVEQLACRPCSKIGHAQCPKGHFRCIKEIQVLGPKTKC